MILAQHDHDHGGGEDVSVEKLSRETLQHLGGTESVDSTEIVNTTVLSVLSIMHSFISE